MGVHTDMFVATDAEVAATDFASRYPSELFPTVEANRVDIVTLGMLNAIVTGKRVGTSEAEVREFVTGLDDDFPCVRDLGVERGEGANSAGPWILRVSPSLMQRLAALDRAQIEAYGTAWARIDELGGPKAIAAYVGGVVEYLGRVCRLCERAIQENKNVYLWLST